MAENPYIIQFPDLMSGKKIMYVHGFGSSAQTATVGRLRQTFPSAEVVAYDMPVEPHEAIALLKEKCATDQPDLIIGTSMGGMYAEQLYGFDRILVNPALQIADTMQAHGLTGKQTFFNPRQDGVQEFYVDKPLVKRYREVSEQRFNGIDEQERQHVWGLFGDRDDLVHTYDLFLEHYPQAVRFHGEHRISESAFYHAIVPVVRWIDDRQQHREREIVYIGWETMHDDYGKAVSSLRKAFFRLIEKYQVYLVCPASATHPAQMAEMQTWVADQLDAPAHNHIIFTNRRDLLYGDFLVGSPQDDNFTGTLLEFGSDEMKTWEHIIEFFERLAGS